MLRKLPLPILLFMIVISCTKRETSEAVTWKIAGALPSLTAKESLGVAGPVSGFSEGLVLIAGGANFPDGLPWEGGKKKYYDDVYLFDPIRQVFLSNTPSLKLPFPVAYAGSVTVSDRIFYAGGENEDGISDQVLSLQWNGTELVTAYLPVLPTGVTNASLHFHNDALYLAGGETAEETSDKIWRLSLTGVDAKWEMLPSMPHPASHAVQLIIRNHDGLTSTLWEGVVKTAMGSVRCIKRFLPSTWKHWSGRRNRRCLLHWLLAQV